MLQGSQRWFSVCAIRHSNPQRHSILQHNTPQKLQTSSRISHSHAADQASRGTAVVQLSRTRTSSDCRCSSDSQASCSVAARRLAADIPSDIQHVSERASSSAGRGHMTWLIATSLRRLQTVRQTVGERQPGVSMCAAAAVPMIGASYLQQLQGNYVFVVGFWAWFAAQFAKIFTKRVKEGVWDVTAIVDSGGMPSSHSSLCMAVTTAVGHKLGLGSPLFAVALAFSLIVMYDAANVRWHAGKQAEVLNIVMADLLEGHPISEKKMKEVLGHTPLQVACGAILGVLVGVFYPTPVTAFP